MLSSALLGSVVALAALVQETRATPVASRASSGISSLVLLGDSYTDNCNAWRLQTGSQQTYPFPACPPAPTGRASGGAQWPEHVVNRTSLNVYNYASSGATCNNTLFPRSLRTSANQTIPNPSVVDQVQLVARTLNGSYGTAKPFDPSTAVAAIFIGTNDLTFFVAPFQSNRSSDVLPIPGTSTNDMAGCVLEQIARLYDLGIRNFLAMDVIPLQDAALFSQDQVPGYGFRIMQNGRLISSYMEQLVLARNGLVASKLPLLRSQLPGATIKTFDTYNFYLNLFINPSPSFGPQGTSQGFCKVCPGPLGSNGNCTVCPDPERYVFFDPLHPSERAGELLAEAVTNFLQKW